MQKKNKGLKLINSQDIVDLLLVGLFIGSVYLAGKGCYQNFSEVRKSNEAYKSLQESLSKDRMEYWEQRTKTIETLRAMGDTTYKSFFLDPLRDKSEVESHRGSRYK